MHPGETASHEISLMCDDLDATIAELCAKGLTIKGEPEARRFGHAVDVELPEGVSVLLYQPTHPMSNGLLAEPPAT